MVIKETCDALVKVLSPVYLCPPKNETHWKCISYAFDNLWNMTHVLGALDGKHIAMDCTRGSGTQYHNYKGHFSLVLLVLCDARYVFTVVDIGQYGSNNGRKKMDLGKFNIPNAEGVDGIPCDLPHYIVGDEIFPLKPWLMRPYPGKLLDERQRIFNYRFPRARRVIENAFAILVARWRIFRGPIRASLENVEHYTMIVICQHNYLQQTENASYCPTGFVDSYGGSR